MDNENVYGVPGWLSGLICQTEVEGGLRPRVRDSASPTFISYFSAKTTCLQKKKVWTTIYRPYGDCKMQTYIDGQACPAKQKEEGHALFGHAKRKDGST